MKKYLLFAILFLAPLAQAGIVRNVVVPVAKATPHVARVSGHVVKKTAHVVKWIVW